MTRLEQLQNKILDLRKQNKLILQNGDVGYGTAPSNIALIKYWGKDSSKKQIPVNSSLSFTLSHLKSETKVTALGRFFPENEKNVLRMKHQISLAGESEISEKMNAFLNSILSPYANEIALKIESANNFPIACGIASSASGYAALCKSIANLLQLEKHFSPEDLQYWLYEWSRLGSGSATRSACLNPDALFVSWEKDNEETVTLNVPYHAEMENLGHMVFVLDDNPKSISSSEGHKYAHTSPIQSIRVAGIETKLNSLKKALLDFDFKTIAKISEDDALFMHSVMQTGNPPVCYLNENTSQLISEFIQLRDKKNLRAFWTLDAGPNVHLLFMPEAKDELISFHAEMEMKLNKKIRILK
jgi:diphosphomevalonate decarboxylase